MAIINKTGITSGGTIEAEHITRAIDALSGVSTDTVVATGSFTGSFTGLFSGAITSASFATSASRAVSSSFATTASSVVSASRAVSSSFATTANTASYIDNIAGQYPFSYSYDSAFVTNSSGSTQWLTISTWELGASSISADGVRVHADITAFNTVYLGGFGTNDAYMKLVKYDGLIASYWNNEPNTGTSQTLTSSSISIGSTINAQCRLVNLSPAGSNPITVAFQVRSNDTISQVNVSGNYNYFRGGNIY
jgi:hypothetical protein